MKKILFITLLFCAGITHAQTIQNFGSSTTTVIGKGAFVADSILRAPLRDTVFPSWLGNSYKRGTIVHRTADSLMYQYNGERWQRIGNIHTANVFSTTSQNIRDRNGNTTPLGLATTHTQFGASGGTYGTTGLIRLQEGTTAADGIQFGTGTSNLYRNSSSSIKTDGNLHVNLDLFVNGSLKNANSAIVNIANPTTLTPPTLTGASATSALSITQTWNTTGNPTAIFANITNTASGSNSNLMDLQVGGVSMFKVPKSGVVQASVINATQYYSVNNSLIIGGGGFNRMYVGNTFNSNISIHSSGVAFSSSGYATPNTSSVVDIQSTTQGFLPPRMTSTQASAIASPAEGLMLYVTDTNGTFTAKGWWGYNGATWEKLNN